MSYLIKILIVVICLGARPERLSYFDEDCWKLMESCWAADPSQRPLLGFVEPLLETIKSRYDKINQEFVLSVCNPDCKTSNLNL